MANVRSLNDMKVYHRTRLALMVLAVSTSIALFGNSVSAQDTAPTIESVRHEVVALADAMAPTQAKESEYDSVGALLSDVDRHFTSLVFTPLTQPLSMSLQSDISKLTDSYALWTFSRTHMSRAAMKYASPDNSIGISTAQLPVSDPLYMSLYEKYKDVLSSNFVGANTSGYIYPTSLMISLTVTAGLDAKRLVTDVKENPLNDGAKAFRFPLTRDSAKLAISLGEKVNEATLDGPNTEWTIRGDRDTEYDTVYPEATIHTPFQSVAVKAAQAKARYESAPHSDAMLAMPSANALIAEIVVGSHELNAFDDSVCVIKQGTSTLKASINVRSPSVNNLGRGYTYTVFCGIDLRKINTKRPFLVTLANVTVFDIDDNDKGTKGGVSRGEIHFPVDPLKMR